MNKIPLVWPRVVSAALSCALVALASVAGAAAWAQKTAGPTAPGAAAGTALSVSLPDVTVTDHRGQRRKLQGDLVAGRTTRRTATTWTGCHSGGAAGVHGPAGSPTRIRSAFPASRQASAR